MFGTIVCIRPLPLAAVLLPICALLALGSTDEHAGRKPDGMVLEVMSFNLRWGPDPEPNSWVSRRERVLALLREEAPAVVGFQESRRQFIDSLLPHLPDYEAYPPSGDRQNAILYRADRFLLDRATSDEENARVDVPERDWGPGSVRLPRCARLLEKHSGVGFYVYNNHLDHRSAPSRQWSVKVLIRRVGARKFADPVILTGDFNAGAKRPALRFLLGEVSLGRGGDEVTNPVPFIDTFRSVHPDERLAGSYHGFTGSRIGSRIDYVLVRPDIRVLDAQIHRDEWNGLYPSDHFPVSATLELPPVSGDH
jgi:endonuclease/exonuclease/phosphatase family metal-dependent hydrolase